MHGDVQLYHGVAKSLSERIVPYVDRELEYPPYCIPLFFIPWLLSHDHAGYQIAFALLVALMDSLLKALLMMEALRRDDRAHAFIPVAVYCIAVPFVSYFYLQRYDIFPAVMTLGTLVCFARGRFRWGGVILAVAAGVKVYPVLLGPMLLVVAVRRAGAVKFMTGAAIASAPLVLLSFFLPWWRFLAFHNERGLQVESLYAAVVWLAHLTGLTNAEWAAVKAWREVGGPLAQAIVPWAKFLMLSTTLVSVGISAWAAWRIRRLDVFQIARLALVPLLPFVAFNIVLSPQYFIWLLPLAALGVLGGSKWPMLTIAVATATVPIIYPSPEYVSGFSLVQTVILLARNLSLVVVWLVLLREFWKLAVKPDSETTVEPQVSSDELRA